MRNSLFRSPFHRGLFIGVLLLALGVNGVWAHAAPLQQGTVCSIEGNVFVDLNNNGQLDNGEPGLGTTLNLLPGVGGDKPVASAQSDSGSGYFCFEAGSIAAGQYRLRQEKVPGYETTGGQDRNVTVNDNETTTVIFPNIEVRATATTAPTSTPVTPRDTATPAPTFTFTATPLPSPTDVPPPSSTVPPSATLPPSATVPATATASQTVTPTVTPSTTTTPTTTPTGTLRPLTPIATFITTTPGVLVTTTPSGPITTLPTTGSGNDLLLTAGALGLLMVGAGIARRTFFSR